MWSGCNYLFFFVVYLVVQNICDCVLVLQSVASITTLQYYNTQAHHSAQESCVSGSDGPDSR
jgi:hypothetical protein